MKKLFLLSLLTITLLVSSCTKETVTPNTNPIVTPPVVTTPVEDKDAPLISMLSPSDKGLIEYKQAIIISGTVSDKNLQSIVIRVTNDADSKELFSKPVAIAGVESFAMNESFTPNDLFKGANLTILIIAKDSKGNEAKKEIKVTTKADPVSGEYVGKFSVDGTITTTSSVGTKVDYVKDEADNVKQEITQIATNKYKISDYIFSMSGTTMVFEPHKDNPSGSIINGKISFYREYKKIDSGPLITSTISTIFKFIGQK